MFFFTFVIDISVSFKDINTVVASIAGSSFRPAVDLASVAAVERPRLVFVGLPILDPDSVAFPGRLAEPYLCEKCQQTISCLNGRSKCLQIQLPNCCCCCCCCMRSCCCRNLCCCCCDWNNCCCCCCGLPLKQEMKEIEFRAHEITTKKFITGRCMKRFCAQSFRLNVSIECCRNDWQRLQNLALCLN